MNATSKTPAGGRRLQDHAYLDALGQLYGTLSAADALLVGLSRLIVEARAQRQAQGGTR